MKESAENMTVKVRILDKEVQIGCTPGDEDALSRAAQVVDNSMRNFRSRNPSSSVDSIAIITAINMANELLKSVSQDNGHSDLNARLAAMNSELEAALASE